MRNQIVRQFVKWWREQIKNVLSLLLLMAFSFLLGFSVKYHYPRMKVWLITEVEFLSSKFLKLQILPMDIELSAFPIGIKLVNLRVKPLDEKRASFPSIQIKELLATISMWDILSGHLRLSTLEIIEPEVDYIEKPSQKKPTSLDLEISIRQLTNLPLRRLKVSHLNVRSRLTSLDLVAETKDLSWIVDNKNGSLFYEILAKDIYAKKISSTLSSRFGFFAKGSVNRDSIHISNLILKRQNSDLTLTAHATGKVEELLLQKVEWKMTSNLDLSELLPLVSSFVPQLDAHQIKGKVDLTTFGEYTNKKGINVNFLLNTAGLAVDQFTIDKIESRGSFSKKRLLLQSFFINNSSGYFGLRDTEIDINESENNKISVKSKIQVNQLELQKFLLTLGLPESPVTLNTNGQFDCQGEAHPKLDLSCTGQARGNNLHVYSEEDNSSIVKLDAFKTEGTVNINSQEVRYSSKLQIQESVGSSQGVVDYKRGFRIEFDSPKAIFSEVSHLAGLKLEGESQIKGYTEGNSSSATLSISANGRNLWLEDYALGNARTQLSYAKGLLSFSDIKGSIDASNYLANVIIGFSPSRIEVSANSSDLNLKDVAYSISRRINIPLALSGTGKAQIHLSGPLSGPLPFWGLSYRLSSLFNDARVGDELFDGLTFNISAEKGIIKANKVTLNKGTSRVTINGNITPPGIFDLAVLGDQYRLDDSQYVRALTQELKGQLDFDLSLKGPAQAIQGAFKGYLSQVSLGVEPIEPSNLSFQWSQKSLKGKGNFFGNQLSAQIEVPFEKNRPSLMYFKAKEWNFLPLLALVFKNERQWDYKSSMTGLLELRSNAGGFWKSTGQGTIDSITIQRGPISMTTDHPWKVIFDNGEMSSNLLSLKGPNAFFKLMVNKSTRENLNLSTSGKIDMSLLSLATPFFSEIRGNMTLSLKAQGSIDNPRTLGSMYVENGLIKFPGFAHTFQNIKTDILFNNEKILINSLSSILGGGPLLASGSITIAGLNKVIVNMTGTAERVHLNVPEGVRTVITGPIEFYGDSFPYTLSGRLKIDEGQFLKEFGVAESTSTLIRQSSFLPKSVGEKESHPLKLNLNLFVSDDFRIKNSKLDSLVYGNLNVKGYVDDPNITGQINFLKGGKIFFQKTPFEISSGTAQFRVNSNNNPDLYVASAARVQEEYDVTLLVQGTGSKPILNLSSQPALTEPEIICLLAIGLTCDKLEKSVGSSQQSQATSYQIGAAVLSQNPLGKQIKERTGFDVEFSTSFDSESTSVPQIVVGRQLSSQMGVKATRSFGKEPKYDAQLFYNFNKNISVIGRWEGREQVESSTQSTQKKESNKALGFDLEYKVEFK
ncbi:MAG: translocation/assembly module TamB domain-containing protein [Pseudomonadota bacterium]|nr:translocation/assembly module TamB domain-containing protein [Pseudomonadota bacterium]